MKYKNKVCTSFDLALKKKKKKLFGLLFSWQKKESKYRKLYCRVTKTDGY